MRAVIQRSGNRANMLAWIMKVFKLNVDTIHDHSWFSKAASPIFLKLQFMKLPQTSCQTIKFWIFLLGGRGHWIVVCFAQLCMQYAPRFNSEVVFTYIPEILSKERWWTLQCVCSTPNVSSVVGFICKNMINNVVFMCISSDLYCYWPQNIVSVSL